MVVEMRTYQTKAGMRERFLEIFRSRSVPEHARLGMPILGPFLDLEHPDRFFFMRRFPDLESREPLKAGFYEGRLWKEELEQELMPLLESYEAIVVGDPDGAISWTA